MSEFQSVRLVPQLARKSDAIEKYTKEQIIERFSYETAIIQNFYDAIIDYIENWNANEEEVFTLDVKVVKKIVEYEDNILELLYDGWLIYRHPERYDFWYSYYNDLPEIIEDIVNYYIVKEKENKGE